MRVKQLIKEESKQVNYVIGHLMAMSFSRPETTKDLELPIKKLEKLTTKQQNNGKT